MAQYVIQIQTSENGEGIGWLARSFEVTEAEPIPVNVPINREQIVMTNTTSFDEIVAAYNQYTTQLFFSYDESAGTISCAGSIVDTWDIN
jgi:hypothetical protein